MKEKFHYEAVEGTCRETMKAQAQILSIVIAVTGAGLFGSGLARSMDSDLSSGGPSKAALARMKEHLSGLDVTGYTSSKTSQGWKPASVHEDELSGVIYIMYDTRDFDEDSLEFFSAELWYVDRTMDGVTGDDEYRVLRGDVWKRVDADAALKKKGCRPAESLCRLCRECTMTRGTMPDRSRSDRLDGRESSGFSSSTRVRRPDRGERCQNHVEREKIPSRRRVAAFVGRGGERALLGGRLSAPVGGGAPGGAVADGGGETRRTTGRTWCRSPSTSSFGDSSRIARKVTSRSRTGTIVSA